MIGKTILHYKITEKLGEGGIGVVYKAQDTKLERTVALKFLSAHSLGGEDEIERFKREAKAAAALNHPNIAHIYAIDEDEGQIFIAMEYVEGQDLAGAIGKSPLRLEKAIDYATQIAAGLQAAHEKGVVHRDIKSANVMVTDKGRVKIMDFGLAKLQGRSMMTQAGTTLGTIGYMSPEQAQGQPVDHRSDIWSLGVVLYEMVSGQLPFKGDYEQAVIYSILNEEPEPLTALRSGLPIALDGIIAKALAKDPAIRYQHVDEIPADLKALDTAQSRVSKIGSTTVVSAHPGLFRKWKISLPWVLAFVLAVVSSVALWAPWRKPGKTSQPVRRFTIELSSDQQLRTDSRSLPMVLSPDGNRLVYAAVRNGLSQLYVRPFDRFDARIIANTEGARDPFFSPDGEWIAFLTNRKLKKVSLSSGVVVTLCDALPVSSGGSWGADGGIYFNLTPVGGIARVSSMGGSAMPVTKPDTSRGELGHIYPNVLPGGKAILFTVTKSGDYRDTRPAVLSLRTGIWTTIGERGSRPYFLTTGHLIYGQAGSLLAAPFDPDGLSLTGSPVRVLEEVMVIRGRRAGVFSVSTDGSLAYIPDKGLNTGNRLVWVDRKGKVESLELPSRVYNDARLSPDGTGLATQITDPETGNVDIWVGGLTPPLTRFTFNVNYNGQSTWTPDGKRVIFSSVRAGQAPILMWKPADGTGVEKSLGMAENRRLNTAGTAQFSTSVSPDGRFLLFVDEHPETGLDIWLVELRGKRKPRPWLASKFTESAAVFSPDGKWIAYQSDASGQFEIYVRPFPGPGPTHRVSTTGGSEPLWLREGSELFYRQGNAMMAVSVNAGRAFTVGRPVMLFERSYQTSRIRANYDVSPDGQRFLMIQGGAQARQIKVVLNWSEELKHEVPGKK